MTETSEPPRSKWADKLEARRERYQERGRLYRVGWVIAGAVVTLGGIIMLVTPGPAFVLIPAGLAMLAMEFAWAEAALEKALIQAERAQQKAKEADARQKVATVVACVLLAAAALAGIFYWDVSVPVINPG